MPAVVRPFAWRGPESRAACQGQPRFFCDPSGSSHTQIWHRGRIFPRNPSRYRALSSGTWVPTASRIWHRGRSDLAPRCAVLSPDNSPNSWRKPRMVLQAWSRRALDALVHKHKLIRQQQDLRVLLPRRQLGVAGFLGFGRLEEVQVQSHFGSVRLQCRRPAGGGRGLLRPRVPSEDSIQCQNWRPGRTCGHKTLAASQLRLKTWAPNAPKFWRPGRGVFGAQVRVFGAEVRCAFSE